MWSIIRKEIRGYFSSPLGYAILAVLLCFAGIAYLDVFASGLADMTYVFNNMITVVFFIIPVITMRLFSEERKQKTDQLLFTSPVSIYSIVLGKFIAALLFFCVFIAFLMIYNFVFMFFGAVPDMSIFFGNVIGMVLFAGSLIAIGCFISSLTESQVVAAVGSFAISFTLISIDKETSISFLNKIINWISFSKRYFEFTEGIFDISNFVFFISIIFAFLFLTVRVIDRKRWA